MTAIAFLNYFLNPKPPFNPLVLIFQQPELRSRPTSSQGLVKRVRFILAAAEGINNTQIYVALQLSRATVRLWRKRLEGAADRLMASDFSFLPQTCLTVPYFRESYN
jgi:hypothetical protein